MDDRSFLTDCLGRLADALNECGVNFALAGGLAFSALVEPRATVDIDLLVLGGEADRDSLKSAIEPVFDAIIPHEKPMTFAMAKIWRVVGVKGDRELIVDFLLADSNFHKEALKRKLIIDFHGHKVPIVTLEDLYILKKLAGRPQDLVDIDAIERAQAPDVDRDYIDKWLAQFQNVATDT